MNHQKQPGRNCDVTVFKSLALPDSTIKPPPLCAAGLSIIFLIFKKFNFIDSHHFIMCPIPFNSAKCLHMSFYIPAPGKVTIKSQHCKFQKENHCQSIDIRLLTFSGTPHEIHSISIHLRNPIVFPMFLKIPSKSLMKFLKIPDVPNDFP